MAITQRFYFILRGNMGSHNTYIFMREVWCQKPASFAMLNYFCVSVDGQSVKVIVISKFLIALSMTVDLFRHPKKPCLTQHTCGLSWRMTQTTQRLKKDSYPSISV